MLSQLHKLFSSLSTTPLHPQWLANRHHKKKLSALGELKNHIVLDIGSGKSTIEHVLDASNYLITSDYPSTAASYQNSPLIYLDARSLPFANDSVDAVIFYEVLEHIDNTYAVLSEITRVLKPGGSFFLSVPFIYPEHDVPHDFFRFSRHGMDYLFNRHALDTVTRNPVAGGIEAVFLFINVYLLLVTRKCEERLGVAVIPIAFLTYLLCLLNNGLAVVLNGLMPAVPEVYLGQSIVAKKRL